MKKILITLAFLIVLVIGTATIAKAENDVNVVVDGVKIDFPDAKPYIDNNGRVMVPVRFVSEAVRCGVRWEENGQKDTVSIYKENEKYYYSTLKVGEKRINSYTLIYEGNYKKKEILMDTVAVIHNDRVYIPVRFVCEALGNGVSWDSSTNTVYIDFIGDFKTCFEKALTFPGMWKPETDNSHVFEEGGYHTSEGKQSLYNHDLNMIYDTSFTYIRIQNINLPFIKDMTQIYFPKSYNMIYQKQNEIYQKKQSPEPYYDSIVDGRRLVIWRGDGSITLYIGKVGVKYEFGI